MNIVIKDLTNLLKKKPVNETVVADAAAGLGDCLVESLLVDHRKQVHRKI